MDAGGEPVRRSLNAAERRWRAAGLFWAAFVPVVALGLFELFTLGRRAFEDRWPGWRAVAAESWGAAVLVGRADARPVAASRSAVLTDDEARTAAEVMLQQSLVLAGQACVDGDVPATTLWVTTSLTEDGRVASIAVEGPTHGRPDVSRCVGEIARHIQIPRFRGPPVTAGAEVRIRPD